MIILASILLSGVIITMCIGLYIFYKSDQNKIMMERNELNKPQTIIEYDEEKIMQHLDYVINESIDNYVLFNIAPSDIHYITSSMEKTMLEELQSQIPEKLSNYLLTQLSYIYNTNYIGTFLGTYIYLKITEYVVDFNMNNPNK